ncbi:restriction endonuclease subunit S [Candidatus Saccharibacteria bacterium]|nr:restriction endonuclease subunit S [Candidatus Saccharibacteria bacterium]
MNPKEYRLDDLCKICSSKRIFMSEYVSSGIPFFRGKEVSEKAISKDYISTELFISNERFQEIKHKFGAPRIDDILITAVGTIGNVWLVDMEDFYFKDGNILWLKDIDTDTIDKQYLYYFLKSQQFKNQVEATLIGSSQKALLIDELRKIKIDVPDLKTQKKIVRILSALDQKIELNNQQNKTIEKQALALVQKYINNEKGTVKLKEIMSFDNGFAFKSKDYVDSGKYKVITIKNVQDGLIDSSSAQFVADYPKDMRDCHKLSVGDVLLSLTGNVGRVGIVFEENLLLNQRVAKMKPKDKSILPFLYFFFRQGDFKQKLEALAKGTAQLNLSPVETLNEKIAYSEQSALELSNRLKPFFEKIVLNNQNNKTLSSVRDSLLPKLISGEINLDKVTIQ